MIDVIASVAHKVVVVVMAALAAVGGMFSADQRTSAPVATQPASPLAVDISSSSLGIQLNDVMREIEELRRSRMQLFPLPSSFVVSGAADAAPASPSPAPPLEAAPPRRPVYMPTIVSISPSEIAALSGSAISIIGSRFSAGARVVVGGADFNIVGSVTPNLIAAKCPPAIKPGVYDVIVTNPDGGYAILPNSLTVRPAASVSNLSTAPTSAAASPRAAGISRRVTITGMGFCSNNPGVSAITLSGYPFQNDVVIPPSAIESWGDRQVSFTAPSSIPAGTYSVSVRGYDNVLKKYCALSPTVATTTIP